MDALADDRIWKIGVCGIVGVGKRTLVNKVIEKVKEENLFDDVAMIVVSKTPNLLKMQGELARKLGLASLREVISISEREKRLQARLTDGGRSLIILYGVWGKIELEEVGIPVGAEHNKECKVVIVTRNENAYSFIGSEKIVIVDPLSNEEALVLLREDTGRFDEELDPIAKQISVTP